MMTRIGVKVRNCRALGLPVALSLVLLAGCGAREMQRVEGETHWLSSCRTSDACGDGLECVCGVCTDTCATTPDCQRFGASVTCVAGEETAFEARCSNEQKQQPMCVRTRDIVEDHTDTSASSTTDITSASGEFTEQTSSDAEAGGSSDAQTASPSTSGSSDSSSLSESCESPYITPSELSSTPRVNVNAELIAVLAGARAVASDEDYLRAVRDYDALVALDARLADFWRSNAQPAVGSGISLVLEESSVPQFSATARCLNNLYGATFSSEPQTGLISWASLEFDGVFNLELVSQHYAALPGVIDVSPDVPVPPPVILEDEAFIREITRDEDVWIYSFFITKFNCSIDLKVTTDAAGSAEILEWSSVPEDFPAAEECQRPDAGL